MKKAFYATLVSVFFCCFYAKAQHTTDGHKVGEHFSFFGELEWDISPEVLNKQEKSHGWMKEHMGVFGSLKIEPKEHYVMTTGFYVEPVKDFKVGVSILLPGVFASYDHPVFETSILYVPYYFPNSTHFYRAQLLGKIDINEKKDIRFLAGATSETDNPIGLAMNLEVHKNIAITSELYPKTFGLGMQLRF